MPGCCVKVWTGRESGLTPELAAYLLDSQRRQLCAPNGWRCLNWGTSCRRRPGFRQTPLSPLGDRQGAADTLAAYAAAVLALADRQRPRLQEWA